MSSSFNNLNNLLSAPLPSFGSSDQFSVIRDNYMNAAHSLSQVTDYGNRSFNDMNIHLEAGRMMLKTSGEENKFWTNVWQETSYTPLRQ